MDEATPHLHLDYIPVAHGYKTGLQTRNSLTKGLQEMGITPAASKDDNETMHWQEREREYITQLCMERGVEIEIIGVDRDNYTIPEYKAAMQATEELSAELEILKAEKEEAEHVIASANDRTAEALETVEDSKRQLDEINSQITECEKRYATYEKKLGMINEASKPVEKELSTIRDNATVTTGLLGGEKTVKLPEKDFNRLMEMAKTSGTLAKLNEKYDKDISRMQLQINKLSSQVKTLKEKVAHHENFLKIKGLLEEFTEFIRPKTLTERLNAKKKLVDERESGREWGKEKRQDIAI
jgi:chromosome segregation ATPase